MSNSKPLGLKPLVLLVHGFKTSAVITGSTSRKSYSCKAEAERWAPGVRSDFRQMPHWLIDDGFEVYIASYDSNPTTTPSNEVNARCLRLQIIALLQAHPGRKIVIIAHSMGGLVTRAYVDDPMYTKDVEQIGYEFIDCVFFLGSPHQAMAHHYLLILNLNCARHPRQRGAYEFSSRKFMTTFNQKYKHTNDHIRYYAIGGIASNGVLGMMVNAYISLVYGPNDGICPTESALALEGKFQGAVVDESHMAIVGKPSYFDPKPGEAHSQTYDQCIRPVLVDGNPYGCKTDLQPRRTMPVWAYPPTIIMYTLVYFLSLFRFLYRLTVDRAATAPITESQTSNERI